MSNIGLFGASGAIGKSIAAALRVESRPYRVVGRSRAGLEQAFGGDPLAEIATWNPDDPVSVRAAARGVDTLVYLVGVPYNHFELHPPLIRKTLVGAIDEGVKRLILIGTVYPFGRPRTERVGEDHPREPHTFKGRMRKEQEDLVIEAGRSGKIQTTILRLPDFYGPGVENSFLFRVFKAAVAGGTADLIGPIGTPHEFVFVPDVGPVVLRLAESDGAFGRTWNLGGAGTITQRDFAERVFRAAGRKPKLRVAGKTMLRLMGLFNPFMRELVEMNYLFSNPVSIDDSALTAFLGGIAKTSYDEGIRRTLQAMQQPMP
jgi:nucleoside-diphosphate-sugar epimerase